MKRTKSIVKPAGSDNQTKTDWLFVFGLDSDGKPRGARFSQPKDAMFNAAFDMGLACLYPASPAFGDVGMKLPAGRIYASGKAFIPNIKKALFDAVIEASEKPEDCHSVLKLRPKSEENAELRQSEDASTTQGTSPANTGLPRDWNSVGIGNVVLVHSSPEEGYFPAVIMSREDDVLTLRYRDYPREPKLIRNLVDIALLNPGVA